MKDVAVWIFEPDHLHRTRYVDIALQPHPVAVAAMFVGGTLGFELCQLRPQFFPIRRGVNWNQTGTHLLPVLTLNRLLELSKQGVSIVLTAANATISPANRLFL